MRNFLAVLLVLTLVACGPTESSGSSARTTEASATETTTPAAPATEPAQSDVNAPTEPATTTRSTPPPAQGPLVEVQLVDQDGYSYDISMKTFSVSYTIDVAGAKPGFANVKVMTAYTGTIANTTSGHAAPLPKKVGFQAVWAQGSAPCAFLPSAFYSSGEGAYCGGNGFGASSGSNLSNLDVGEARAVEGQSSLALTIDEGSVAAFEDAMAADPDSYAIGVIRSGQWTPATSTCGIAYNFTDDTGYVVGANPALPECTP